MVYGAASVSPPRGCLCYHPCNVPSTTLGSSAPQVGDSHLLTDKLVTDN
ncbi:hypothetical protein HMPREF9603_02161 [Cutibacterium acnes HL001PA1]|nr:hypothetical protein HMPREF9603_02161 [Cutibacterium acnes HL001PA1]EFT09517.1 hypothetical protein HMPREF9619_01991 [Cutibacterium acnes HL082PA2]